MIDFYGNDADYIHLKFGRAQKQFNFTKEFREKHGEFAKEYEKFFWGYKSRFANSLEVIQYVDMYNIPVHFYFNYTDTPAKNIEEVYAYLLREYSGINYNEDGSFRNDYRKGLDGEEEVSKSYMVVSPTKIAQSLIDFRGWTKESFEDGEWPDGWTNDLMDAMSNVEEAVAEEVKRILKGEKDES